MANLKINDIDLHIHSELSQCTYIGRDWKRFTVKDIIKNNKILKIIGISDHFAGWTSPNCFFEKFEKIKPLLKKEKSVRIGVESDYLANYDDVALPKKYRKEFDYIMGSLHRISNTWISHPAKLEKYEQYLEEFGKENVVKLHVEDLIKICKLKDVNILAHPFIITTQLGVNNLINDEQLHRIATAASKFHTAIEINKVVLHSLKEANNLEFFENFLKICREHDCLFTYGSDAHHYSHIGMPDWIEEFLTKNNVDIKQMFIPEKKK